MHWSRVFMFFLFNWILFDSYWRRNFVVRRINSSNSFDSKEDV